MGAGDLGETAFAGFPQLHQLRGFDPPRAPQEAVHLGHQRAAEEGLCDWVVGVLWLDKHRCFGAVCVEDPGDVAPDDRPSGGVLVGERVARALLDAARAPPLLDHDLIVDALRCERWHALPAGVAQGEEPHVRGQLAHVGAIDCARDGGEG